VARLGDCQQRTVPVASAGANTQGSWRHHSRAAHPQPAAWRAYRPGAGGYHICIVNTGILLSFLHGLPASGSRVTGGVS
jgi:hypothetical protein